MGPPLHGGADHGMRPDDRFACLGAGSTAARVRLGAASARLDRAEPKPDAARQFFRRAGAANSGQPVAALAAAGAACCTAATGTAAAAAADRHTQPADGPG